MHNTEAFAEFMWYLNGDQKKSKFLLTTSGHFSQVFPYTSFFKSLLGAYLLMIKMLTWPVKRDNAFLSDRNCVQPP